jgi:hypothetical protein
LMQPFTWKTASSVNMMLCIKLGSMLTFYIVRSASSFLFGLSAAMISWSSWILYTCNLSVLMKHLVHLWLRNTQFQATLRNRLPRAMKERLPNSFYIFLLNCRSSRWLSPTNATCFFELFEPVTDVVHTERFTSNCLNRSQMLFTQNGFLRTVWTGRRCCPHRTVSFKLFEPVADVHTERFPSNCLNRLQMFTQNGFLRTVWTGRRCSHRTVSFELFEPVADVVHTERFPSNCLNRSQMLFTQNGFLRTVWTGRRCCSHRTVSFELHSCTYNAHWRFCFWVPQDNLQFFFVPKHYQQRAMVPTGQADTET